MTLADLIARVEGLTGPDRETNWLVAEFLGEVPEHTIRETGWDYTASIDAVVALIERELPGWMRSIMTGHGKTVAHVRDKSVICEDKIEGSGYSSLEACALLSAFLRALDAIAQRNGGKT